MSDEEDHSVKYFLELDGTHYFIGEKCNYRVNFQAKLTDVTPQRPHGLSYSLTLHDTKNKRILGYDNAHPVPANKGPSGKRHKFHDHWHKYDNTRIYKFTDTQTLLVDFFNAIDKILEEKGIKT